MYGKTIYTCARDRKRNTGDESNGKTNREIAEHFGFKDKYVVKEWVKRYNRRIWEMKAGITPRRRARSPKGYVPTEQKKDNGIRRLKTENELLRDFFGSPEEGENIGEISGDLWETGKVPDTNDVPVLRRIPQRVLRLHQAYEHARP